MSASNIGFSGYSSYAATKNQMGNGLSKTTNAMKNEREAELQAGKNGAKTAGIQNGAQVTETKNSTKTPDTKNAEKETAAKRGTQAAETKSTGKATETTNGAKTEETKSAAKSQGPQSGPAAVYEPTKKTESFAKLSEEQRRQVADTMRSMQEAETQGIRDMVQRVMSQQMNVWQTSLGNVSSWTNTKNLSVSGVNNDHFGLDDEAWEKFTSGNFSVDAATKKKAQDAISDNGYWGVEQTSNRILKFAQALAGNDPEKLEKMQAAFEKGYNEATKAWGKELPEISRKTRDAVLQGFKDLKEKAGLVAT